MSRSFVTPLVFTIATLLSTAATASNCKAPPKVNLPDGASATEEQMVKARRDIIQYQKDGRKYLDCLAALDTEANKENPEADKIRDQYEAVLGEMQSLQLRFEEQIAAYGS